jgi:hypothetical protein
VAQLQKSQRIMLRKQSFHLIKTMRGRGRQLQVIFRLHISVALEQKTANFKVASGSRPMQWSALTEATEAKQKNKFVA